MRVTLGTTLRLAILGTWCVIPCRSKADPSPSSWSGVPAQVIPTYLEPGAPTFTTPTGSASSGNTQGGSTGGTGSGGDGGGTAYTGGGGAILDAMMAQSYGQTAYSTAQQLGNNPTALAAFGQLESGWRNVATSNGTSSATGPWQITGGTWGEYVFRYNLPYSSADRTNPEAQAVVSNYILKDYAGNVSAQTGQSATVAQTYAAWVYGPGAGAGIAGASASEPLSNYASARNLSNNNMTGWTVSDFNAYVGRKVGPAATQTVRS